MCHATDIQLCDRGSSTAWKAALSSQYNTHAESCAETHPASLPRKPRHLTRLYQHTASVCLPCFAPKHDAHQHSHALRDTQPMDSSTCPKAHNSDDTLPMQLSQGDMTVCTARTHDAANQAQGRAYILQRANRMQLCAPLQHALCQQKGNKLCMAETPRSPGQHSKHRDNQGPAL